MLGEPPHTTASPEGPRPNGRGEGLGPAVTYHEPPVLRYFRLLWDHRRLVVGGSLLPALLLALVLYLWPARYTATVFYERPLAESEYDVLLRRFHSQENWNKMVARLQERGLTRFVRRWERAQAKQSFEKLLRFDVSPMYPTRFQTTDPCTSEKISAFRARLLSVQVFGRSEQEAAGVAAVVTDNLESILPLYDVRHYLGETLAKFRDDAARIETDRFQLSVDLQKEKAKLEKLKALENTPGETASGGTVLQFNVEANPSAYPAWAMPPKVTGPREMSGSKAETYSFYEFLPLPYQIRAVQAKIIDLQETLANNAEKYNFYLQAMDLDHRLLAKIDESLVPYYTAQQYLAFLGEQLLACKDPVLGDHLRSYIRKTENLIQANTRAGAQPLVYPVAKDILRNTTLALVLLLMTTALVAVVLEHRQEQRRQSLAQAGPTVRPGAATMGMAD